MWFSEPHLCTNSSNILKQSPGLNPVENRVKTELKPGDFRVVGANTVYKPGGNRVVGATNNHPVSNRVETGVSVENQVPTRFEPG